jgi:hypothetical protein
MKKTVALLSLILSSSICFVLGQSEGKSPIDELPPYITRLTHFGQRGDWSHDGNKLLFLAKTFGDVYEVDIHTKVIRPITHHYFHEGYTRALYLANGDILLSGARRFDSEDPWPSRGRNAELWILAKELDSPPVPLGTKCSEGPAVSRKRMTIAWTIDHGDYPDQMPEGVSQMWMGDIVYDGDARKIVNKKLVLDSRDLDFEVNLETQNFVPPDEKELIFSAYGYEGTETMGVHIETGKVTNYSKSPYYEEPEGIGPTGEWTLVEADRYNPKGAYHSEVYRLYLDGSAKIERITRFGDYPGYRASNPVVRDDGKFLEFQLARTDEPAGVGHGIFILDIEKARAAGVWK